MAKSYETFGPKSQGDTIAISIPFISRDHISVLVDGEVVSDSLWTWVNDGLIECLADFPTGPNGRIVRTTPDINLQAQQAGAAVLDFDGLNNNDIQLLYLLQEKADEKALFDERVDGVEQQIAQVTENVLQNSADAVQAAIDSEQFKDEALLAKAAAEAAAAGVDMPSVGSGDKGKVLIVNDDEDGWDLGSLPSPLAKGSTQTAAATLAIPSDADYFEVDGSTTITAIDTTDDGREITVLFNGTPTLTHGADLVLPEGKNIKVISGDIAKFMSDGSGQWHLSGYIRNITSTLSIQQVYTSNSSVSVPEGATHCIIEGVGGGGAGGGTNGANDTYVAGGGGASGFYGKSAVLSVEGLNTIAVTIGAGGSPALANSGGPGSQTSVTVGSTSYTFPGGSGGQGGSGTVRGQILRGGVPASSGSNVIGSSTPGQNGICIQAIGAAGAGGASPWGIPGEALRAISGAANGVSGGRGAGGGGGYCLDTTVNRSGGNGGDGMVVITWIYGRP